MLRSLVSQVELELEVGDAVGRVPDDDLPQLHGAPLLAELGDNQ